MCEEKSYSEKKYTCMYPSQKKKIEFKNPEFFTLVNNDTNTTDIIITINCSNIIN